MTPELQAQLQVLIYWAIISYKVGIVSAAIIVVSTIVSTWQLIFSR